MEQHNTEQHNTEQHFKKCSWCSNCAAEGKSLCIYCHQRRTTKRLQKAKIQVETETLTVPIQKFVTNENVYKFELNPPKKVGRVFSVHVYFNNQLWGQDFYLKLNGLELPLQYTSLGKIHFLWNYTFDQQIPIGFKVHLTNHGIDENQHYAFGIYINRMDRVELCSKVPFPLDQEFKIEYFYVENGWCFGKTGKEEFDTDYYLKNYTNTFYQTPEGFIISKYIDEFPAFNQLYTIDTHGLLIQAINMAQVWDIDLSKTPQYFLKNGEFQWNSLDTPHLPFSLFLASHIPTDELRVGRATEYLNETQKYNCLNMIKSHNNFLYFWYKHSQDLSSCIKTADITFYRIYNVYTSRKNDVFVMPKFSI